jgi:hypothetical protein
MPTTDSRIATALHLFSLHWLSRWVVGTLPRPEAPPRNDAADFVDTQASWHNV